MVRGVRGGWAGQRWADTREGQSRERAVVWPHGGFPSQGLGGPASSHCKPPFSVRGWGGSGTAPPGRGSRGALGRRAQCASCAFSSALCKRAHHPVSMATGIPQRGERGGTLRKDSGKGTARVRVEGNTQEGVTWFCCRLTESVSGAPRLVRVCPLLVPRRWQGGDATWPSPANTLALRHTA